MKENYNSADERTLINILRRANSTGPVTIQINTADDGFVKKGIRILEAPGSIISMLDRSEEVLVLSLNKNGLDLVIRESGINPGIEETEDVETTLYALEQAILRNIEVKKAGSSYTAFRMLRVARQLNLKLSEMDPNGKGISAHRMFELEQQIKKAYEIDVEEVK